MKHWRYDTAEDLERPMIERLKHFPREPDILIYLLRSFAAVCMRAWLRLYHRFEITGLENLPASGSFVLVANHSSHLDAPCLVSALPLRKLHRVFPAAAADYFFQSVPRIWFASVVINALPFSRQVNVRQSMCLCEKIIENPDNVLVIFPEGTRTADGEMGRFKPGIGALLAGRKVTVLPCHLEGAYAAWSRHHLVPRPGKLELVIGPPRTYDHLHPGKESSMAIAAELHDAVQQLAARHDRH
ncbi:MAG: lysophospholipid acyltransferase family protein [Verrucomicrobiota bacterium]